MPNNDRLAFLVPLGMCGMQRTRTAGAATSYETVIVVSLHRVYLTTFDRAFRVTCIYTSSSLRGGRNVEPTAAAAATVETMVEVGYAIILLSCASNAQTTGHHRNARI
jgi:hypothetical protein